MPPNLLAAFTVASTLPLSFYALTPGTPALSVVLLVACVSYSLRWILHAPEPTSRAEKATHLTLLFISLVFGSAWSFAWSNASAFDGGLFSNAGDALVALVLYSLGTALLPFLGLLFPHLFTSFLPSSLLPTSLKTSYARLLFPAWRLALAGVLFEYALETGRVGWWIRPSSFLLDSWVRRVGGQVAVDVVVAAAGIALADAVYEAAKPWVKGEERQGGEERQEQQEQRDLLEGDTSGSEEEPLLPAFAVPSRAPPASPTARRASRHRLHRPLALLSLLTLFSLLRPLFPSPSTSAVHLAHPSPSDPSYVYPPIRVACVVPPHRHAKGKKQHAPLEDWLAETTVVAGRGAKVVSWREGAVRLHRGASEEGKEGWEGMGEEEKELLKSVGEISNMYHVYVLATYLVPPAGSSSSHKFLNVATLVGPRSLAASPPSTLGEPHLVWSTTKQHPVPFIESYSHPSKGRTDKSLASKAGVVPLAKVALPLEKDAPGRKSTPHQEVSLGGAICQDVAFPSLLSSFASPPSSPSSAKTPQLLLNPSYTPISSLSHAQLDEARARAVEHNAFILRCDGQAGSSALLDPRGRTTVLIESVEGGGSWEAEIRPEEAARGTVFERLWLGGRSRIGSEGAALSWLAVALAALAVGESGVVQKTAGRVEWKKRAAEGWARVRRWTRLEAGVRERGGEEGRETARAQEEGRLVEVD